MPFRFADRAAPFVYVVSMSLLLGVSAAVSATGVVTLTLVVSLALVWSFVPILHVAVAAAVVRALPARGCGGAGGTVARGVGAVLALHGPWSTWLVAGVTLCALFGYTGYRLAVFAALVPLVMTWFGMHRAFVEVLGDTPRRALVRLGGHQALTWGFGALYVDRAVSLTPRVLAWLS